MDTFLNFSTSQLNTFSRKHSFFLASWHHASLPFFFPGPSPQACSLPLIDTYRTSLDFILRHIFVFALRSFPWLSHPLLGGKYDPSNGQWPPDLCRCPRKLPRSSTWMSCRHLKFHMVKLNSLPSSPTPHLQTSFPRATHFKNTSLVRPHQTSPPLSPHLTFRKMLPPLGEWCLLSTFLSSLILSLNSRALCCKWLNETLFYPFLPPFTSQESACRHSRSCFTRQIHSCLYPDQTFKDLQHYEDNFEHTLEHLCDLAHIYQPNSQSSPDARPICSSHWLDFRRLESSFAHQDVHTRCSGSVSFFPSL